MKRRYSREFAPPAPVVGVVAKMPGTADSRRLEGKIDSGADACALPEAVIADLDLPPVRMARVAGFGGELQEAMIFHVDLEVAGIRFEHVEALATRRPYALIGRNVLNALVVKLDGPRSTLLVDTPRARRSRQRAARP